MLSNERGNLMQTLLQSAPPWAFGQDPRVILPETEATHSTKMHYKYIYIYTHTNPFQSLINLNLFD